MVGRPGYRRCLEPSNFLATSLRYQARMVSGLAMQATSRSALLPHVSRSRRGWRDLDHSTPISMAALPSGFGSPRPDIHSAEEAPGSPIPSRTLAVATTSCSSCRTAYLTLATDRFSFLTIRAIGGLGSSYRPDKTRKSRSGQPQDRPVSRKVISHVDPNCGLKVENFADHGDTVVLLRPSTR